MNEELNSVFFELVKRGDLAGVQQIVTMYPALTTSTFDFDGKTALTLSLIEKHNIFLAQLLLSLGVSINEKDALTWTTLHHACFLGDSFSVDWLCQQGANVSIKDSTGSTSLLCSAHSGSIQCAKILLSFGAKPNEACLQGWTAIHYASMRGHEQYVSWFVNNVIGNNSIDVLEKRNADGQSPADMAATPAISDEIETASLSGAIAHIRV